MTKIFATVLMAFVLLAGVAPKAAQADQLYWTITNNHPNSVELVFYSQDDNYEWPGNGQVYIMDGYGPEGFNLECEYGELICYGAWLAGDPNGIYWGVGPNSNYSCPNCCATCGFGNVDAISLDP